MTKVLIIDDDMTVVRFLKDMISQKLHLSCDSATTMKAAKELLVNADDYTLALVDVVLPDGKDGECIDLVLSYNIPVIAMTGSSDSKIRQSMIEKGILDYVSKENPNSFDYAMRLLQFVHGFKDSEILLVDDSMTSRLQVKFSLDKLPLKIHEAKDGCEALLILKEYPQIKLLVTDKQMPNMGGIELIKEVRKLYTMDQLSIIGISASNEPMQSVEFLKNGANDFVTKPYEPEEMLSRVISNLEMLYYINLAKESAIRDYLTGLYNRKYLYETGSKLYENARREQLSLVVAMIDIDHFKKINDRYGHEAGDKALKMLGKLLSQSFRDSDIVARYGGEEFCVLLTNTDVKHTFEVLENVRKKVEKMLVESHKISFRMTLSIGLNDNISSSFDQMIAIADEKLYQAKHEGRNRVLF